MKKLPALGHDAGDRLRAMDLAQEYGGTLYTGVFYRDPAPGPSFEAAVAERHRILSPGALPCERILDMFAPVARGA